MNVKALIITVLVIALFVAWCFGIAGFIEWFEQIDRRKQEEVTIRYTVQHQGVEYNNLKPTNHPHYFYNEAGKELFFKGNFVRIEE